MVKTSGTGEVRIVPSSQFRPSGRIFSLVAKGDGIQDGY